MKKTSTTLIFLLAALVIHSHVHAQKVLLDEDFNTNKNNWPQYSGKTTFLIYNGKLIFSVTDTTSTYNLAMPVTLEDGNNFSVTVTTTHTDGIENNGYGLYFGAVDINSYYSFYLTCNGYFRVSKTVAGTGTTDMIKWTQNPAIKTGSYVDNIMQMSRQGANWIFAVNGQTLATLPATPFLGNKIGFSVITNQRIEYDNVKMTQQ